MEEKKVPAHIKEVIEKMEALGIYKAEFNEAIERYVKLKKEYKTLYKRYEKSGYQCEIETERGVKKAPIVAALESLRRDILTTEEALGLTPRGLLKLNERAFEKPKESRAGGLI